ncbi:hypothetical protein ABZP36_004829 [Zizania latifolia]
MSSSYSTRNPGSVVANADGLARKVIADFDTTLTGYWYDGSRGQSMQPWAAEIGEKEYDAKREALFEHYHPIEICPDILLQKAKLMEEW